MILLLTTLAMAGGDPCDDEKKVAEATEALKALYEADKADFENGAENLDKLVSKRVKEAKKLAPYACSGQAKYYAGALLYRSRDPEILEMAHELGKASMMDHIHEGPWLTAVTYDKWQISRGLEQRYATQLSSVDGHGTCLWPIAADSTDEERAQYGMPKVIEAYRRVLDANGFNQEDATAEAVARKKLWCDPDQW